MARFCAHRGPRTGAAATYGLSAPLGAILLSRSSLSEKSMAKSQARSSRETRKPKAEKVKTNASKPSEKTGVIRGLDNMKNK
jgi:hypothetical protein